VLCNRSVTKPVPFARCLEARPREHELGHSSPTPEKTKSPSRLARHPRMLFEAPQGTLTRRSGSNTFEHPPALKTTKGGGSIPTAGRQGSREPCFSPVNKNYSCPCHAGALGAPGTPQRVLLCNRCCRSVTKAVPFARCLEARPQEHELSNSSPTPEKKNRLRG
jgi:hypothetical protein